jgi:hypothetical protein
MPQQHPIAIVGAGVAGLLLVLLLKPHTQNIVLIDPHHDGGDLNRRWHTVISNTRWEQALQAIEPHAPIPAWARQLSLEQPTTLAILARLVREVAAPALRDITLVQASVVSAARENGAWTLQLSAGEPRTLRASALMLATGATPKQLNLPIPSIPLEVALDPARLKDYVQPTDHVVVFGTRHSGTLVLKNCLDAGVRSVTGIYRGDKPFLYARDGEYDGIKLDAATYADQMTANPPANLQFARCDDMSCLVRATRVADWVIYATGFEPRVVSLSVDGATVDATAYDGKTGAIRGAPAAWGFGVGYPSLAPDGVHWDVGVAPFMEHMRAQVQPILDASNVNLTTTH